MADTFDETRLDARRYQLSVPTDAFRYQQTVLEFFEIVRNAPDSLQEKPDLITKFCQLLDDEKFWPLAVMIVPELRKPQSYDISEPSVRNNILRQLCHRRPSPSEELAMESFRKRKVIGYVETEDGGLRHVTEEEWIDIQKRRNRDMVTGKY